jgi:hydroxycarboxylate dehydrogenase B
LDQEVRVPPRALEQLSAAVFRSLGADEATSRTIAEALVDADLAGHPSHGVLRIPEYVEAVREGRVQPSAVPAVTACAPAVRLVDGAWGFGAVAMEYAVRVACEAARGEGVAAVAIVRTNHIGRLGRWVERILEAGYVGLLLACESDGPYTVAPFGGTSATLTTNPIAFGFPRSGAPPVVGDFATGAVAWGKLDHWQRLGEPAPVDVIVDSEGEPTLDIGAFMEGGAIRAFGGHKGSALALMVELFASALTAASARGEERELAQSGFLLVLDPERFGGSYEAVAERVASVTARVASSRPEDPLRPVLLPGEVEARARSESRQGIPLPASLLSDLAALAAELGVDPALLRSADRP